MSCDKYTQTDKLIWPVTQRPHLCNCIGPKNGEPVCPCKMANVIVRDGRYIQKEVDLGPVKKGEVK